MAIAYDNVTTDVDTAGRSSATFAHTCTGSDLTLRVEAVWFAQSSLAISSITYNGVNLTQRKHVEYNWVVNRYMSSDVWTLDNPATGSNNVVVTYSGSVSADAIAATSVTGANNGVGANTSSITGDISDATFTFSTTSANDWMVANAGRLDGSSAPPNWTPGTSTVERSDIRTGTSSSTDIIFSNFDEPSTGGSDTINSVAGASNRMAGVACEILAAAVAGGNPTLFYNTIMQGK